MARYMLQNDKIAISVDSLGAELRSLKDIRTGQEYMWEANPIFWGRTSPILFPIVGSLKDKRYTYHEKTYTLPQHGFAREMEFSLLKKEDHKICLGIQSNGDTLEDYPFLFTLEIEYEIKDRQVEIIWRVRNKDQKKMHFSIGGHPAFICPFIPNTKKTEHYIQFDVKNKVISTSIVEGGLAAHSQVTIELDNGMLPITEDLFDLDALIIEEHQAHRVALLTPNKKPYLTVEFKAPLFGIWSPPKKNAPFICIEPWYGRCDKYDFHGSLENREWSNTLDPSEKFEESYKILI
ncbi:MAG TPA: aldose 1-epimerase family protein [Lachnospiraceae bacterium]|nr:aldose 1-epimerase family protein [Lachnospiraceae bacterium]